MDNEDNKININFLDNLRIMFKLCPNKKHKRLVLKGTEKLKKETDIVQLIKGLRNAK